MQYIPIRCPSPKQHEVFNTCSSLLGILDDEGNPYFYCNHCSRWFKLSKKEGGIEITKMPLGIKFKFDDELKVVND